MKDARPSMKISQIYVYPIKSTAAVELQHSHVGPQGLDFDRRWALIGNDGTLITAREHPKLLKLTTKVVDLELHVFNEDEQQLALPLHVGSDAPLVDVQVYDATGTGVVAQSDINNWFSSYLGLGCRLMFMNESSTRPVLAEAGGSPGDTVSYADECPLMMLSEATLDALNQRLPEPMPMTQFRPNLVVNGCDADAEDGWQRIRIGSCEYDMLHRVKRCVFATIDPESRQAHAHQEPLRTLSTYRRHEKGGVAFGRHLIARSFGNIRVGDEVEVLQ